VLPILFELGPIRIFGYGAAIALGGIWAFRVYWLRRKQIGLPDEESYWILLNGLILSGFGGAHLLFLLQYARGTPGFEAAALSISGGYSVFGSFLSVTLFVWLFARWKKIPFLRLADYVFWGASLGHAFGRVGCFLAGCCYGKPTGLPWAVVFRDPRSMIPHELLGVPLHPVQLYEAAADAVLAAVWWQVIKATDEGRVKPGAVVAGQMTAYGVLRFFLEFVRADALPWRAGLTSGQALGLGLAAGGVALFFGRAQCTRSC
jgi:phosphatidylglycerol:prolipoprotein diacylglycerol transferase